MANCGIGKVRSATGAALWVIGGTVINTIVIHRLQEMARHHFAIRRLERKYGKERVKQVSEDFIST